MNGNVNNQNQQNNWSLRTNFQDDYETTLRIFLEEFIVKLNLPEVYKELSFGIYEDILASIKTSSDESIFAKFYESLELIKTPRYVSATLLLIALLKNEINITQKDFTKFLELQNEFSISRVFNSLLLYLKTHPDYSFIYRFIPVKVLTQKEYPIAVREHLNYFSCFLTAHNLLNRKDTNSVLSLFTSYSNTINDNMDSLYLKHPKYIASTLCWMYLIYYKDFDISAKEFIDIIQLKKDVRFSHKKKLLEPILTTDTRLLSKSKKDFTEKIFKFKLSSYKSKVIFYAGAYLQKIKYWILKSFSQEKLYNRISHYFETEFLPDIINLFEKAIENGFEIHHLAGNNQIYYYFPQTMALSLIFYSSRRNETLQKIINGKLFKMLISLDPSLRFFKGSYRYISESENRLYPFIKEEIGRYKGQIYSKNSFKTRLTTELKRFYHLETDFLLKLYSMTDLSPFEFGNKLNIHSGRGVTSILQIVENKAKFTEPRTFFNIKKFIMKNLTSEDQKKSLIWLNNLRTLRYKDFRHGSITYSFKWVRKRQSTLKNSSLYRFLFRLWKGIYPREIFTDPKNTRASNLKFHGTTKEPMKTIRIEQYFSKVFEIHDSSHYLCKCVRNVFNHYKINRIGKYPDHPPILNYILSEEKKAMAIEIPVWKEITGANSPEFFIGHIDLLLIEGDTLIIADYKPKLRKIYKSIPQITVYAMLLRERLKDYSRNSNIKIKCVGFSKDQAIEWDPDIVFSKIIEFVEKENMVRISNLLTASRKNKKDLLKEIQKLKSK